MKHRLDRVLILLLGTAVSLFCIVGCHPGAPASKTDAEYETDLAASGQWICRTQGDMGEKFIFSLEFSSPKQVSYGVGLADSEWGRVYQGGFAVVNGTSLTLIMTLAPEMDDPQKTINGTFRFTLSGDRLTLTKQSGDSLSAFYDIGAPMEFVKAASSSGENSQNGSADANPVDPSTLPAFDRAAEDQAMINGKKVVSPDGRQTAYLEGYDWESIGRVTLVDTAQVKKENVVTGLPNQHTPCSLTWLDNRYLLVVVKFAYGTVTYGGDVYLYDTATQTTHKLITRSKDQIQIMAVTLAGSNVVLHLAEWDTDFINSSERQSVVAVTTVYTLINGGQTHTVN